MRGSRFVVRGSGIAFVERRIANLESCSKGAADGGGATGGFTEETFGQCPECDAAMRVEGEDPMSAVDPSRVLGTTKALQPQSDNSRFATRLRCENGHQWWMLTEDMRAAG